MMAKKASFTVQSSEKVNHINGWLTMPRRQGQCQKNARSKLAEIMNA